MAIFALVHDLVFGDDSAEAETPPDPNTAQSAGPSTGPGPTAPGEVPNAAREVDEVQAPCTRFEGRLTEISSISNAVTVTVAGSTVSAPYWTLGPPSYEDGVHSTHPAAVPTQVGSDVEMDVIIEVAKADGLSGTAELVGSLMDDTRIEWKGTFPVAVGTHTVTVKTDHATTELARHMGDVVWEASVPGCGDHIVGRTRVEIYRIVRDHQPAFLSAGRPAEALRFMYENMGIARTDVALPLVGSELAVTSEITYYLHSSHGLTYDVNGGRSFYLNNAFTVFYLLDYISRARLNVVNCYDQASGVLALAAVIGIDGFKRFVGSQTGGPAGAIFGFINETTLVGGIRSNNPFYATNGSDPIESRPYPVRTAFGNHQFYMDRASAMVFDACAGPHLGTEDYATYMDASVDLTVQIGPYQSPADWRAAWAIDDHYAEFTSIV